ncbi:hypothetical protein DBR36_02020 [Microbacterium sp. HMWF026]|uniref:hypothetical protein n=1 Tax=Microbacterium sp. HMWF026 TaxID=2056861 RepID=UPI000D37A156|nr:hypothetical protein [Microbacterium sp. HMWF026]PTT22430.1 hypothetical protein DBR36_02020 [Microbacterium sp. HMWF026]
MTGALRRDDIITGLSDLILDLRATGSVATIQIVGGAAIALTIDRDRPATADVDGTVSPPEVVAAAAAKVARQRGWPDEWINDRATGFLPSGMGRSVEWTTLYDHGGIVIQAASAEMLLAMKLRAMERRGLRDAGDVAALLGVLDIHTAEEAEALLNGFFPGEDLTPRTFDRVHALLGDGPLDPPRRPEIPDFS